MSRKAIEIIQGTKYGMLTVLDEAGRSDHGDRLYSCVCDCGTICIRKGTVIKYILSRGYEPSCGCNKINRKNCKKDVALSQLM